MKLYAIKLDNGNLYKPKEHGVKVYTRYQDARMISKRNPNSKIVSYVQEFL